MNSTSTFTWTLRVRIQVQALFMIGLWMIQLLIPSHAFSFSARSSISTTTTRPIHNTYTCLRRHESVILRSRSMAQPSNNNNKKANNAWNVGLGFLRVPVLCATSSSTSHTQSHNHHPPKRRKRKSKKSKIPTKKKKMKEKDHIHLHHPRKQKQQHHPKHNNIILQTLQTNNFDQRLISIQPSYHLPLIADVHANGGWQLCVIHGIKVPSNNKISKHFLAVSSTAENENGDGDNSDDAKNSIMIIPPLIEVILIEPGLNYHDESIYNSKCCTVDIGQITSIWHYNDDYNDHDHDHLKNPKDLVVYLSKLLQSTTSIQTLFPVNHVEKIMQRIYDQNHSSSGTRNRKSLTKKDITKISSQFQQNDLAQHVEQILKRGLKGGLHDDGGSGRGSTSSSTTSRTRIVDSNDISIQLFENTNHHFHHVDNKDIINDMSISREKAKLIASKIIATDTELGGRFKRTGCIFVSANYYQTKNNDSESYAVDEICLLNGGWTAVDASVKTGTEARKFVERSMKGNDDLTTTTKVSTGTTITTKTIADERILHRLECFAMGEVQSTKKETASTTTTPKQQIIDHDIRETLSALNLPLTPEGAQRALVQSGRWSSATSAKSKSMGRLYEPWSNDILEVSRNLVQWEVKRKHSIWEHNKQKKSDRMEDGRINLMSLPCICIDAKRASFRDDAIGVRPRSSTGRKVVEDASKWEILIHIADVSDVYLPASTTNDHDTGMKESSQNDFDYSLLRKAAETRTISRYDLPFGPLHLMPPVALDALALVTRSIESSNKKLPPVNRCVTLWAYIDERDGKLLDAGLERSIISAPVALTFESASNLLNGDIEIKTNLLKQVKAMLTIAERNLAKWKENRLQTDKAATEREKRLQIKEMVAKEIISDDDMRDDGSKGSFQRTRGHRMVDNSLDLYGNTLTYLLSKSRAPIPRASGSSAGRDGRVATAPLRRYIDGIAQRQALSILCSYGGPPMTRQECDKANKLVNEATKSLRKSNPIIDRGSSKRIKSLQRLENHLLSLGEPTKRVVQALSIGEANEVVISGLGLSVKCEGVPGSLKTGQRVLVEITKLDTKKGVLQVHLYRNK